MRDNVDVSPLVPLLLASVVCVCDKPLPVILLLLCSKGAGGVRRQSKHSECLLPKSLQRLEQTFADDCR